MKRILLLICCLGMLCAARGQTQLHYWFDRMDATRVSVPLTDTKQWHADIDVNQLTEGLHTVYFMAEDENGRLTSPSSRLFIRSAEKSEQVFYRCWFDKNEQTVQTGELTNQAIMLDVSDLTDGLHTVYVQALGNQVTSPLCYRFLKASNMADNEFLTCTYIIDRQVFAQKTVQGKQDMIHVDLDVASLNQGVHQLQAVLATESGAVTGVYTAYFYRAILRSEVEDARLVYMIDGKSQPATAAVTAVNGALHYDLDVSSLSNGLHCISYALVGSNGVYGTGTPEWFYKIPAGGEGLVSYDYWLNDDEANMRHIDLPEHLDAYHLVSLLAVDKVPVRSSLFQFAYKNDTIPVVYAKNDFHVRFWESGGSYALADAQYVDERACDTVYADTLRATNTIPAPKKGTIYWYCIQAKTGDSIAIKTDKACELHIFSPSAEELYRADAVQSVEWGGCHANEKGLYYIALHDHKADGLSSITLSSQHIDRYAVLRQNANRVGNGGFSTITYEGNGFDSLYSVYLVNAYGNTIESEHISHESNTKASVTFDFTDVALGEYDAVFEFTDDEIYLDENIIVEEPVDIELTSSVDFPSTYLEGETVTYELTITNEGNMTAYQIPIFIYIGSHSMDDISYIQLKGLHFSSLMDYFAEDPLSESDVMEMTAYLAKQGDDFRFFKLQKYDVEIHDSVMVRSNYFYTDIAPYETKKIEIVLKSKEQVEVWSTIPTIHIPYITKMGSQSASRIAHQLATIKDGYCCIREHLECGLNIVSDIASFVPGAPTGVVGCVTSTVSQLSGFWGSKLCGDSGDSSIPIEIVTRTNNTISFMDFVTDCGAKFLPIKGIEKLRTLFEFESKTWKGLNAGKDVAECLNNALTNKKPNCPPGGSYGGTSDPVDPSDPNDIRGYTSESGSKYMRQDVETIHYEIEYENDTAVASAPAHTIIVRDTLDASRFDLTSFATTEITIGDRKMKWNTPQGGTQTLDMRTRMNVIAQVQLDYSEQTGIAQWTIKSLDPMTMEPIISPDLGVLPVNFDGNGMGTISYRINLKNRFDDGTQIANRASIIFDNNEPIMTPVWVNTVDAVQPVSLIESGGMKTDSVVFVIRSDDNRSKVWYTTLFARKDAESEWETAGRTYSDSITVLWQNDWTQFYVQTTDSAGNVENKNVVEYSLEEGLPTRYIITFYDDDGVTVLDSREWVEGSMPSGTPPTKPADDSYEYVFEKWIPDIVAVTQNADYMASYLAVPKTPTDLPALTGSSVSPRKVMINGILYILLPDGRRYNMQGMEVK